jgi:ectoine hydroxylase-related dioxygenase (phytanoyl-CoA dioxygenase family)
VGPPTPFHQDAAYWPIDPPATTTVWVAVRESKRENACLRVVPMSKMRFADVAHGNMDIEGRGPFDKIADPGAYEETDIVDVELEAGEMVLFDCHIVHGASANTGRLSRTAYSIRYMPATSRFDHGETVDPDSETELPRHLVNAFSKTPLIVVRGKNRNPGNDLERNQELRSDR